MASAFRALDGLPVNRIDDIMPWRFKPVSTGTA